MFPILPWPVIILILLVELALVVACCVAFALILNWILKMPLHSHLTSTGIVAAIGYLVTGAILLYTLPPLHWVNTVPQDERTWVWDHLQILSGVVALISVSLWQLFVRMKHKYVVTHG